MIRGVLFDFRDTLLDIAEARKANSLFLFEFIKRKGAKIDYQQFEQAMQLVVAEVKQKHMANTGIHNWNLLIVNSLLNKLGVKLEGRELEKLMQQYDDLFAQKVALYPDAVTILNFLKQKGTKMGVVIDGTSKRERAIIQRLGLDKYFNVIIISEEVGRNKLSNLPLGKALEKMALPAANVMVVGDRIDKDILPANKLGCVSVKLERKAGRYAEQMHNSELEKPRYAISTLTELASYID